MEVSGDVILVPLANGGITGIRQSAGVEQWRKTFGPGLHLRGLATDGSRVLGALCDERSLMEAGCGSLISINPDTGDSQTVWKADSHSLSRPVIVDGAIYLCTSSNNLYALTREPSPQVRWVKKIQSWLPLPPLVSNGMIIVCDGQAMQNSFLLAAYHAETGQEVWRESIKGLLPNTPAAVNDALVYVDDRDHCVTSRRADNGKLLWQKDFNRVYSNLASDNRMVFFSNRGNNDPSAPDHYVLTAARVDDGKTGWQINLPARVSRVITVEPNMLLLGTDGGSLLTVDTGAHQILWEYSFGSNEDPLRTDLTFSQGAVIAGTYSGKLAAVQVIQPSTAPVDAEAALREGHIREGAEALALQGDFERAAQLFLDPLVEPEKAIALYACGRMPEKAARLAFARGMYDRAMKYYADAGDREGQAVCLEKMGNELEAAALWLDLGDPLRAARLFETGGEPVKAWEIFRRLGQMDDANRLSNFMPADVKSIEAMDNNGLFSEAARLAVQANLFERAVKLYQKANDADGEYSALAIMNANQPEEWSLTRQIEMSRSKGLFNEEAEAWARLNHLLETSGRNPFDNYEKTGEAFKRAALQAETRESGNHEKIAGYYEEAGNWFARGYKDAECQLCREKVIAYRRLPEISLTGHANKEFVETEFNELELHITNKGAGVAVDIQLQFEQSRFDVECPAAGKRIDHLNSGASLDVRPSLCPKSGQRGLIPFTVKYTWKDVRNRLYSGQTDVQVTVKRLVESGSGSGPNTYIYQAPVYTSSGPMVVGNGKIVNGNEVTGDYLEKDAQKGDRVEIIHGSGRSVTVGADSDAAPVSGNSESLPCPVCSLPVAREEKFCTSCGAASPWNRE
jgi:outer membrane protein assembly factor BamB/tetratricopeptide (TPR) repeat protein